jgi:uncharacterized protein (TIGR03086 family)
MDLMSPENLSKALPAVGHLIAGVQDDQWAAPTPCTEWTVRGLVGHLVGMNKVFVAMLTGGPMPEHGANPLGDNPLQAYRESGDALLAAAGQPGVLEQVAETALGKATGASRLNWRVADLLAHGWDLAQATGQRLDLPGDIVEESLVFVQAELPKQSRTGRFEEPQPVAEDAPAIERLVAFLGRKVS